MPFSGALSVEKHSITIQGLPGHLDGMRIAQLSDFHFDGVCLKARLLDQALGCLYDLHPDLIALTGDFVTDDPEPIHELASRLRGLPSRYGTFAVLGNHDIQAKGAKKTVRKALERADIRVLWNQVATPMGSDFPVVGLADYWSSQFDPSILETLDPARPRLVLSHNPDTAELLTKWRVDLQLSGHTHGGQIYIPGFGPGPLVWQKVRQWVPVKVRNQLPFLNDRCFRVTRHWEWCQGLHQVGDNWLYVNRGLGSYFPGRFFCTPELTLITLLQAPHQD